MRTPTYFSNHRRELGLRASLLVVFFIRIVIARGIMIALHAKDRFGLLPGCGIVSLVALQAAVNIGVTTSPCQTRPCRCLSAMEVPTCRLHVRRRPVAEHLSAVPGNAAGETR
jgi:hypothetical protein